MEIDLVSLARTVLVPIVLTVGAGFLEALASFSKGIKDGDKKYLLWIRDRPRGRVTPRPSQTLQQAISTPNVVDIDRMGSLDFAERSPVGIHLTVGAIAIDLAFGEHHAERLLPYDLTLAIHIFLMIGATILSFLCARIIDTKRQARNRFARLAIGCGFFAMLLAFAVIKEGK